MKGLEVGFVTGDLDASAVARLEALPIDSLWVGGHVASANPTSEGIVSLARLAALSQRVRIGTSILLVPLYPPALLAKQLADLDRATSGRLSVGVGVGGEYPQEFRACQVPISERGARADEALPLLRTLWSARAVSHVGRFYSMEDVRIHPAPIQTPGPPLIVAGRKRAAMRRATALGDGWMPYLYSARRYADSVTEIRRLAAASGRDLTGFEWCVFLFVNLNRTHREAVEQAAAGLGGNYRQDFTALLPSVAVAGTAPEVREQLQAFVEAGARHLIISPIGHPQPAQMQIELAEEILPALTLSTASGVEP